MKKKGLKIYLFRHGQTDYNRDGRFTGSHEAKLTTLGKKHALKIAQQLKDKKFQVAVHTHLSRSKDTLKPVLKNHPECKIILEDDRMIERGYGILEGTTHEQFIEKIGNQEYELLVHGDAIEDLEQKQRERIEDFLGEQEYNVIHRGWKVKVPEGESFADVEKRVRSFLKDLKKFMKKNKVNVVISAHGNSIRLFRKIMEKESIENTAKWFIPYDKVFTYEI